MAELTEAQQVLLHRMQSHEAALDMAERLGWPAHLADSVRDTRTRMDECQVIYEALLPPYREDW